VPGGTIENRVILPVPAAIVGPAFRVDVAFNGDHGRGRCLRRLRRGVRAGGASAGADRARSGSSALPAPTLRAFMARSSSSVGKSRSSAWSPALAAGFAAVSVVPRLRQALLPLLPARPPRDRLASVQAARRRRARPSCHRAWRSAQRSVGPLLRAGLRRSLVLEHQTRTENAHDAGRRIAFGDAGCLARRSWSVGRRGWFGLIRARRVFRRVRFANFESVAAGIEAVLSWLPLIVC